MMMGGFRAGRMLGFRIRIDYSWFIVLALVTWTFARWQFPIDLPGRNAPTYLLMGLSGALLLFLSVLLHELAHSVVARSRGIEVAGITLFIFGGVAEMRQEPTRPLDEFLLTIVGPLSSLALAAAFLGLAYALTAIDADVNKNDAHEVDRFRIKIWWEDGGGNEFVIYDNGLGGDDDDDNSTTEISGGSIVIHKK